MLHIDRIKIYQKFMNEPENLTNNEYDVLDMFDAEFQKWLENTYNI